MVDDLQRLLDAPGLPTTLDLTRFVRLIPDPAEWTLNQFLPDTQIQGVKYRTSTLTRRVSAAKFRAYDAQTPLGRRVVSRTETEGLLPPIGQKTMIGEFETILLQLQRGANEEELVRAIYDDGESNSLAIRARLELARGDLLTDFKFTLSQENGLTLEADFGAPTGHLPTAATLWSNPAATPISDELAWIDKFRTDTFGITPELRITSPRVFRALQTNNEYRQAIYPGLALSTVPTMLTPGQVQAARDIWGLPALTMYDAQIDVDGTPVRPIPDTRFLLTTAGLGQTQIGMTAESLALTNAGNPRLDGREAPGIVATRYVQDDPVSVWVRANAVAMPVIGDPNRLITATVL